MADTQPNPDSGAAGTEYQTLHALRKLGHLVDEVWGDELFHKIRHGNLHYLLELPFAYRSAMLARLSKTPYDVVHVNQPHGYLAARKLRSMRNRAVFVHRSHGFEPRVTSVLRPWQKRFAPNRPLRNRIATSLLSKLLENNNRGVARYADGHIFSSSLCADFLHQRYGVDHKRIAVIAQAPPDLFRMCAEAGCSDDRLSRILYVGQFAFIKAPVVLAEIFDRVLDSRPGATLTWVCDARHHHDASSLLSARARERTRFLDWLPQDRLIDIYDSHGILLFPSFFEGFGKAFLEAMCRGLIVIASDEGGAHDLICNGLNGFVAAVGDAARCAEICVNVQVNPELARSVSTRARQTALQYSWDRVAAETADFYYRLGQLKHGVDSDG